MSWLAPLKAVCAWTKNHHRVGLTGAAPAPVTVYDLHLMRAPEPETLEPERALTLDEEGQRARLLLTGRVELMR